MGNSASSTKPTFYGFFTVMAFVLGKAVSDDSSGVSLAILTVYGAFSIIAFIILAILCGLIAAVIFVPVWWIKVLCAAVFLASVTIIYYKMIK